MLGNIVALRIGDETFYLSPEDAARVEYVMELYPDRAVNIARRLDLGGGQLADGQRLQVRMTMQDRQNFPTAAGVFSMANTKTVTLGDGSSAVVDSKVADEIQQLRDQRQAMLDVRDALAAVGGRPGGVVSLADAARDAQRAEERRRRDPKTSHGAYIERLESSWKGSDGRHGG